MARHSSLLRPLVLHEVAEESRLSCEVPQEHALVFLGGESSYEVDGLEKSIQLAPLDQIAVGSNQSLWLLAANGFESLAETIPIANQEDLHAEESHALDEPEREGVEAAGKRLRPRLKIAAKEILSDEEARGLVIQDEVFEGGSQDGLDEELARRTLVV